MKQRIKSLIRKVRKQKTHNQNSKQKKRIKKSEDSVRSLWGNFKPNARHNHRRRSLPSRTPQMPEMSHQVPSFGERTLCWEKDTSIEEGSLPSVRGPRITGSALASFSCDHLLQFFYSKNGPEVILVKEKPIFALDFEKGRGLSLPVLALPGRGYEKVTFALKAQLMFYVFLKSHHLNLISPSFKTRT